MKNLVVGVSAESSLSLLKKYADVVTLDKDAVKNTKNSYDTVYIRSHFSDVKHTPEFYREEIELLVNSAQRMNPDIRFIDRMDTVDEIMSFEDKWNQYNRFGRFMPQTEQYEDYVDVSDYVRPVFKQRLSSNGSGVTWIEPNVDASGVKWIVQESLEVREELRIYVICGEVYPVGAIRTNMTEGDKAVAIDFRSLTNDEMAFASNVAGDCKELDFVGLDVARDAHDKLYLIEVNRSPGFAKFQELTGVNLAELLYEKISNQIN